MGRLPVHRDRSQVTKQEVHEVYSQLPIGAVVEQPDGTRLYGAPADSSSAHPSPLLCRGTSPHISGHLTAVRKD